MSYKEKLIPRTEELEAHFEKFPDLPKEVIIKEDCLRLGLRFSRAALDACKGYQPKLHYMFSFDASKVKVGETAEEEGLSAPLDIKLESGRYRLRPTVIQVRLREDSPYLVDVVDGKLMLCDNSPSNPLAEVRLRRPSQYYSMKLSDGTPYYSIISEIRWGYSAFCTVLHDCQYWKDGLECKYCDISAVAKQQRLYGKPIKVRKRIEDVVEVADAIFIKGLVAAEPPDDNDPVESRRPRILTLDGGTITSQVGGKNETEFYSEYAEKIKEKIGGRCELVLSGGAQTKESCKRLRDAGVDILLANVEVWDKRLFQILCPGKDKFVGRDEWVRRLIEAVDVFGVGHVCPAFVYGVEMAKPWGFKDVDSAVESTTQGFDYLMSYGVFPRPLTWIAEPMSALHGHPPVPLEYYCKIDQNHAKLWKKHRIPVSAMAQPIGPGSSSYSCCPYQDAYQ